MGSAGVLVLGACASDASSGSGDEPLSTQQIQSVLMGLEDFPGEIEHYEEHFGDAPRQVTDEGPGFAERFGGGQCAEALEEVGEVDGDNAPEASGQRWVSFEAGSHEQDGSDQNNYPALRVFITSYEDEAAVEEYWDETQEACDGELLESDDDDLDDREEVTLETAEVGEFRGLTEYWDWDPDTSEPDSVHHRLSYAHGHQVIHIGATDLDEETVEDVLDLQVELLEEGPEDPQEDDDSVLEGLELPYGQMSSAELSNLVLSEEDFSFPVEEFDVEEGPESLDTEDSPWMWALFAAVAPAFGNDETRSDECENQLGASEESLIPGEVEAEDVVLASAQQPPSPHDEPGIPTGAVVLLTSDDYAQDEGYQAEWDSLLNACAGEHDLDNGTQSLEEIDIAGVQGFSSHVAQEDEDESFEMNSHLAHHEFGHNSLRVIGMNLMDEQMEDVVVDQLEKLDQDS